MGGGAGRNCYERRGGKEDGETGNRRRANGHNPFLTPRPHAAMLPLSKPNARLTTQNAPNQRSARRGAVHTCNMRRRLLLLSVSDPASLAAIAFQRRYESVPPNFKPREMQATSLPFSHNPTPVTSSMLPFFLLRTVFACDLLSRMLKMKAS